MSRRAALLLAGLLAWGCAPEPVPADPALWEVTSSDGGKGWLFGTVHALDRPARWQTAEVNKALAASDMVLVEISDLDSTDVGETFSRLATTPGMPPLSSRIGANKRRALREVLESHGLRDDGFGSVETWAAALSIAQAATDELNSEYGIDRAVVAAADGKTISELEGAAGQLALFDLLPEAEQRDLLEAIIVDAKSLDGESTTLIDAWRTGDMATIARETETGLLADPELREALFTGRNRAWTKRIAEEIARNRTPFVAVGAAHMAGPEGLPAMLVELGYKVERVR